MSDKNNSDFTRKLIKIHGESKRLRATISNIHKQGWGVFYGTIRDQNRVTILKEDMKRLGLKVGDSLLFLVYPEREEETE